MNIVFIGGGNMATAMISGMLQQGYAAEQFRVVEIDEKQCERLRQTLGVTAVCDVGEGIKESSVIVLAVKPQQLFELSRKLAPLLDGQLILSIAAGICAADIARWLNGYRRIIRAMPNTPSLVRSGVTGLYAMPEVSETDKQNAESILSAVGAILWVDEEDMLHAVTAISGSGPAYVFYFIESMQQAGIELGLSVDQAQQLSVLTFMGASKLASLSEEEVAILRNRVTSKGGTTEQAILAMDKNDVKAKIILAIHAANQRSREMSNEYSKIQI